VILEELIDLHEELDPR